MAASRGVFTGSLYYFTKDYWDTKALEPMLNLIWFWAQILSIKNKNGFKYYVNLHAQCYKKDCHLSENCFRFWYFEPRRYFGRSKTISNGHNYITSKYYRKVDHHRVNIHGHIYGNCWALLQCQGFYSMGNKPAKNS